MSPPNPNRATTTQPQHPKLRHAASHAIISAGLRKLRPKRSNIEPLSPLALMSSPSISHYSIRSSSSASPPVVFSNLLMNSASTQVPDSGPLPTYLAQLHGIHFVGDPNQDPDLDDDTVSNIVPFKSTSTSTPTSSISLLSDRASLSTNTLSIPRSSEGDPPDERSLTNTDASSSILSLPSVHNHLRSLSPPNISNQRPLSPRTCKAAFPPIDLESPHAPYAPTPPLSPPAMNDPNNVTNKTHPFHIPKTLRKLPSTASMFRKGPKPFTHRAHETSSGSSTSSFLRNQSLESIKPQSNAPSMDNDTDRKISGTYGPLEHFPALPSRAESRSSGRSCTTSTSFNDLRHRFRLTSHAHHHHHPLQRNETVEPCSTDFKTQVNSDVNRTITSKTKGLNGLFSLPITRMRTYSALSGVFKPRKPELSTVPSSSRPSVPTSEVHASISALLSIDSGYEILAYPTESMSSSV
ncbi:hypothetical protein CROQUDRAFT_94433 [Cronartium quercuum f. sp. fusiforme G11]|uniref:Uncharacterized protein n=1 Tax=Cronartium quercuum f. sp. fusiforme G11 TaxID=708437 RepID=A0A9P6NIU8_9BASI|nr:hypothetical protein CROQUDRAFT_94433 [Cronartium quercuum f. sp. fusiforme G11]